MCGCVRSNYPFAPPSYLEPTAFTHYTRLFLLLPDSCASSTADSFASRLLLSASGGSAGFSSSSFAGLDLDLDLVRRGDDLSSVAGPFPAFGVGVSFSVVTIVGSSFLSLDVDSTWFSCLGIKIWTLTALDSLPS